MSRDILWFLTIDISDKKCYNRIRMKSKRKILLSDRSTGFGETILWYHFAMYSNYTIIDIRCQGFWQIFLSQRRKNTTTALLLFWKLNLILAKEVKKCFSITILTAITQKIQIATMKYTNLRADIFRCQWTESTWVLFHPAQKQSR